MRGLCPKCGLVTPIVVDGVEVDACFKDLLGRVVNACCGHGDPGRAYVRIERVHSNGTDGFVDVWGGEVAGPWRDRKQPHWQKAAALFFDVVRDELGRDELIACWNELAPAEARIIAYGTAE